jgi:hypothetical protein
VTPEIWPVVTGEDLITLVIEPDMNHLGIDTLLDIYIH